MRHILAADVGGTHIRTAIVDSEGAIRGRNRIQAELSRQNISGDDVAAIVVHALQQAIGQGNSIEAVCIGFPGFFRGDSGIVAASPNIPSLQDFPIAQVISNELGLPAYVQNDALCAAIGEQRFGAGRGCANLLHITLGTGIGGGLILNNAPYFGENGMALEIGHLCVDGNEDARACGCGNSGCVEAYASATAVVQRYAGMTGIQTDAATIHARASQGNETAAAVLTEAAHYLGMAIAEAIKLLDVRTVSISGGLTGAWDILYPPMMAALNSGLIAPQKGHVVVRKSELGDDAGLLGAASLAQTSLP